MDPRGKAALSPPGGGDVVMVGTIKRADKEHGAVVVLVVDRWAA